MIGGVDLAARQAIDEVGVDCAKQGGTIFQPGTDIGSGIQQPA